MINVKITEKSVRISNPTAEAQWNIDFSFFWDTVVSICLKHSDHRVNSSLDASNEFVNCFTNSLTGKAQPWLLFGEKEYGQTLMSLYPIIEARSLKNGRETLDITDELISEQRNLSNMNIMGKQLITDAAVEYSGLSTPSQVIVAVLEQYQKRGLKLVRCMHCGKWFATNNLHEKYCKRQSPCVGMRIAGKPLLREKTTCEQAVRNLLQKFRDRYKSIYNNWYVNAPSRLDQFLADYSEKRKAFSASPTVENAVEMQTWLYSEEMPKQTRPNRRPAKGDK